MSWQLWHADGGAAKVAGGAAGSQGKPGATAGETSCGQRTHWHLTSQVVGVAAVVHLLDMSAPAEVGAMHAMVRLLAQTACIDDVHAAYHALQKPLVAAAMSLPCQVTARHDGGAAPWRVAAQAGGRRWSRRHQLALRLLWVDHMGLQLGHGEPALRQMSPNRMHLLPVWLCG